MRRRKARLRSKISRSLLLIFSPRLLPSNLRSTVPPNKLPLLLMDQSRRVLRTLRLRKSRRPPIRLSRIKRLLSPPRKLRRMPLLLLPRRTMLKRLLLMPRPTNNKRSTLRRPRRKLPLKRRLSKLLPPLVRLRVILSAMLTTPTARLMVCPRASAGLLTCQRST